VTSSLPVICEDDAGHLGNRVNSHLAGDTFEITTDGLEVCARRTDSGAGWGMHLEIVCVATGEAPVNPDTPLPATGVFRMQQKSNMKFVDAHESGEFNVVTRTLQANPSQYFYLESVGELEDQLYTIQQVGGNGANALLRFIDAHESSGNDFRVVTRTAQNNPSQRWHFTLAGSNTFTIQQEVNGRYLDAYENGSDGQLVTRTDQDNDSQKWVLTPLVLEEETQALQLMAR